MLFVRSIQRMLQLKKKMERPSIVVVLGCTGVGKSRLAVELCSHNSPTGEIVNADSMQVYKGIPVLTNKLPHLQRNAVPHHLLDFLEPQFTYSVPQFVEDAKHKISEIFERQRLPVLVGGTAYYIQHLLFPGRMVQEKPVAEAFLTSINPEEARIETIAQHFFPDNYHLQDLVGTLPDDLRKLLCYFPDFPAISTYKNLPPDLPLHLLPSELQSGEALAFGIYSLLLHFDEPMATRWHWKDVRKTSRNLTIILTRQKRSSDIMHEQQAVQNNVQDDTTIPLYRTLILIPYADPSTLNPRLDIRVDEMIQDGMIDEVDILRKITGDKSTHQGAFQAIGYKELDQYLNGAHTSDNDKAKALEIAIDGIKTSNRQYAKRQLMWMKRQLAPLVATEHQRATDLGREPLINIYALDVNDPTQWVENVRQPAFDLVSAFVSGKRLPRPEEVSPISSLFIDVNPSLGSSERLEHQAKIECTVCSQSGRPVLVEKNMWSTHQSTRLHRRMVRKSQKHSSIIPPVSP